MQVRPRPPPLPGQAQGGKDKGGGGKEKGGKKKHRPGVKGAKGGKLAPGERSWAVLDFVHGESHVARAALNGGQSPPEGLLTRCGL